MTYSQGGLIQAVDYNTFAQGGSSVNHGVANINTVWGVGNGDKGYGQTNTLTAVAVENVTATQWATLIARLDSTLTHQAGSGSGLSQPTAGSTISFLSSLSGSITTGYNNRLNAASNGSDAASAGSSVYTYNNNSALTSFSRTATFASADQARYFFNAGGKLIWTVSASNSAGNTKGTAWATMFNTNIASIIIGASTNSRSGSGGTQISAAASKGYWTVASTSASTILKISSDSGTADYSNNTLEIFIHTSGVAGSNADVGAGVTITFTMQDVAADSFDDTVNLAITTACIVRPPETTNLSDTWGSPTFS